MFCLLIVIARGFPRCKPNWIPDKMPDDKMLENKTSENGKPDKMSDNLTRTLTLSGSGPFMSLFTHTHTHTPCLSLYTLSMSTHKHISIILHTLYVFLSFSLHAHSLSLYHYTHTLSLFQNTLLPSLCTHFPSLSLSLFLSLSGGVQPHFCPLPNPDFHVSWEKMGEKVFVLANCWYFIIIIFGILIIRQYFSCNILHDLVMTLRS